MSLNPKKSAFTIVELLAVMSIIIILASLLLPAVNRTRRHARDVAQKNHFRNIDQGLEMYRNDFDDYPDSSYKDINGDYYCGAMKLCEVMAGQDGLGFHPDSKLCFNGGPFSTNSLYPPKPPGGMTPDYETNIRSRKEYLEPKDIQICSLENLYGNDTAPFDPLCIVLGDVFRLMRNRNTAERVGMPILYYKADVTKILHDPNSPPFASEENTNIYNYTDNQDLLELGLPNDPAVVHPLFQVSGEPQGRQFYNLTWDKNLTWERDDATASFMRPYKKDSYILISAGWDGLYGTRDDIYNFAPR